MRVLVAGATGYIGGRLVPALLDGGHEVVCLARTPAKLDGAPWRAGVEVVAGDVLDAATLGAALEGCDAAYYLVHSIGSRPGWEEADAQAAANFRDAAAEAGVGQIVYLGGLGDEAADLSAHLASRHEVGAILAAGPVPVTELRAAVIIGSGSASFEMLRYLVDVLPAMVTPRWVQTRCQPIAVRDVLRHLVGVLGNDAALGRVFEIGGPETLTYREMMRVYAQEAGLRRRLVVPVPVLSPRLSSLWVGLVTPLPSSIARPLVDSLTAEVVVRGRAVTEVVPGEPLPYREAVRLALRRSRELDVPTSWSDASRPGAPSLVPAPADRVPTDPPWAGGSHLTDERVAWTGAPPEAVFAAVTSIGGERGWYGTDWLWGLRGLLDSLAGGVGRRRGRRHPDRLGVGDALDWWRVEVLEPGRFLRLAAEMRMPGRAWLEWEVEADRGGTSIVQRARFVPRGLAGLAYWYALAPVHAMFFPRLLRGIVAAAGDARSGVPVVRA